MTEPQRHKLVAGGALVAIVGLLFYLALFGFGAVDPKGLILMAVFFAAAVKVSTIKRRHNPMF
ncbi:MAG: hypothetical protein BWY42_01154 [Candidatus Omnitrophica bacterium ADurb.Bin277]|nr:MAG: hypothetical protein BWY42_01154 [Candidatus Omnitrophica bacterium ADurb.Bin277]